MCLTLIFIGPERRELVGQNEPSGGDHIGRQVCRVQIDQNLVNGPVPPPVEASSRGDELREVVAETRGQIVVGTQSIGGHHATPASRGERGESACRGLADGSMCSTAKPSSPTRAEQRPAKIRVSASPASPRVSMTQVAPSSLTR